MKNGMIAMTSPLPAFVRFWARRKPAADAVIFPAQRLTWAELDRSTDELATGMRRHYGVAPGDRVVLSMDNCPEYVEAAIAILKLGAIVVPVNNRWTAAESVPAVEAVSPSLIVCDARYGARLEPVIGTIPAVSRAADGIGGALENIRGQADASAMVNPAVEDPAVICFTSGTTGVSKGAVMSHGGLASAGLARMVSAGLSHEDRVLLPISLSLTAGLTSTYLSLVMVGGMTIVVTDSFDPDRTLALVRDERVTLMNMGAPVLDLLVNQPGFASLDIRPLRTINTGGTPIKAATVEAFGAKGVAVIQNFAQTESASCGTSLGVAYAASKAGTVGLPELFMDMKIVDEHDQEVPTGEPGEILLRGPQIMTGYWNQPQASAETLRGGWLHTGDVGSVDEDGFLRVLDRLKDMLISGGLNVYSAEVERVLAGCAGVTEVAVIGVPDDRWDEVPLAVVRGGESFDPGQLRKLAERDLADYKRPKYLVQVDEALPRNASGKVMKPLLRQRWPQAPADAHVLK
jgi:fatty-acyl-CoA synthase